MTAMRALLREIDEHLTVPHPGHWDDTPQRLQLVAERANQVRGILAYILDDAHAPSAAVAVQVLRDNRMPPGYEVAS